MNSKVESLATIEQLDCIKSNNLQTSEEESVHIGETPIEETTDKKAIVELEDEVMIKQEELLTIPNDNIKQENDCLNHAQDIEMKDEVDNLVQSDTNKIYDQDADVEEEVVERDEERDKVAQDGSQEDGTSSMGRNRRVRQKNRYFLDFHCVDLTKGGRSNKEEYEAFTNITTTATRSSNRRSTLDSNRASQDEPDVFETKYCRKCSSRTPHDVDSGCQACLYKKIVESSKRQRPSHQRNRSSASKHHHQQQQQQQQQQQLHDTTGSSNNNHTTEAATITTTIPTTATNNNNNKRKTTKQSGSNKIINNSTNQVTPADNNNITDNQNVSNSDTNSNSSSAITNPCNQASDTSGSADNTINMNNKIDSKLSSNETTSVEHHDDIIDNKYPKLDAWSPNEVADYIQSKGFADEAELFKTQSVDGISLLLMQRTDFTYGLKIKLGPALKIYDQVCRLKKEYFRNIIRSNHSQVNTVNT